MVGELTVMSVEGQYDYTVLFDLQTFKPKGKLLSPHLIFLATHALALPTCHTNVASDDVHVKILESHFLKCSHPLNLKENSP